MFEIENLALAGFLMIARLWSGKWFCSFSSEHIRISTRSRVEDFDTALHRAVLFGRVRLCEMALGHWIQKPRSMDRILWVVLWGQAGFLHSPCWRVFSYFVLGMHYVIRGKCCRWSAPEGISVVLLRMFLIGFGDFWCKVGGPCLWQG